MSRSNLFRMTESEHSEDNAVALLDTTLHLSTDSAFFDMESYETHRSSLAKDWNRYNRSSPPFADVLHHVFGSSRETPPSHETATQSLAERLSSILLTNLDRDRYRPFAVLANKVLAQHYERIPLMEGQRRVMFTTFGDIVSAAKTFIRPDIAVVLRDEWEAAVKTAIKETSPWKVQDLMKRNPCFQKHWTEEELAFWDERLASIRRGCLTVDQMTQHDLALIRASPSWRNVIAVVEFKAVAGLPESAQPQTSSSSPLARQESSSSASSEASSSDSVKILPTGRDDAIERETELQVTAEPSIHRPIPEISTGINHRGRSRASGHEASRLSGDAVSPTSHSQTNEEGGLSSQLSDSDAHASPPLPSLAHTPKILPSRVRLMGYCHRMGSDGRERVTGALVDGTQMCLISCDREGLIQSSSINLVTGDGARLFSQWVTAIGTQQSSRYRTLAERLQAMDVSLTGGVRFESLKCVHKPNSMFGRSTTVFKVKIHRDIESKVPEEAICKVSWQPRSRTSEVHHITRARSLQVVQPHLPEVWANWTEEIDEPSRVLLVNCLHHTGVLEQREMRAMITPVYLPLEKLSGKKFLDAFKQIMQCCTKLYEADLVQHRDISLNNMMYYIRNEAEVGVLNDWDFAWSFNESKESSGACRTGTPFFMARDLQFCDLTNQSRTIWHDLESGLYVLLFVALGYKQHSVPTGDPLKDWRIEDPRGVARSKNSFIAWKDLRDTFLGKVQKEYEPLKEPIRQLTDLFFELDYQRRRPKLDLPPIAVMEFFKCLDSERP